MSPVALAICAFMLVGCDEATSPAGASSPCGTDSDCGFGYRCDDFVCVGQSKCADDFDCLPGTFCQRPYDEPLGHCAPPHSCEDACPVGEICSVTGTCLGQHACAADLDCAPLERCEFGSCTQVSCESTGDCPLGSACDEGACREAFDSQVSLP